MTERPSLAFYSDLFNDLLKDVEDDNALIM